MDQNDFKIRLGKNLSRIRSQSGLSQEEMEDYGISRAYYGRVEIGAHSISIDKLNSISKAFGVPLYQLFIGVPLYQLFIDENGEPL